MSFISKLLRKKQLAAIEKDTNESKFKRELGAWDLISVGVGGIIGAGIFVLAGMAAKNYSGPGIVISFLIAGFVSTLSSLCYAELSSSLPVSGSAYSYTYVAIGEFFAWIIGWDLMLEYLVGAATVAVGWAGHLEEVLVAINKISGSNLGFNPRLTNSPIIWLEANSVFPWTENEETASAGFFMNKVAMENGDFSQALINLPAMIIVILITILLVRGIKESVMINSVFVVLKLLIVLLVIGVGFFHIDSANYTPFIPENEGYGKFGISGLIVGATTVFFAYIGFDSVSTVAQESKNPGRDLPIGIIGSLTICTVLYILVSIVLTGMVPYDQIDEKAGLAHAFEFVGLPGFALIIAIGGVLGLTSVLINVLIGQPRIFQAMSSDGLFSPSFGKIHPTYGTPYVTTITTGAITAVCAALLPIDLLGNITSMGTLFAFFFVSLSVMVLRFTAPDLDRKFKIGGPNWFGGYFVPGISTIATFALICLSGITSISRVLLWMALGVVFYFFYGFKNSKLNK